MTDLSAPRMPAKNLEEVLDLFEPTSEVRSTSDFYVQRDESGLRKLTKKLKRNKRFHGFLCGHVGSGKTTELIRLAADKEITASYYPVLISVKDLQIDSVNLTHDALLVGIGLQLVKQATKKELSQKYQDKLEDWGKTLVNTFVKDESINAQVGATAGAWIVHFKTLLKFRSQWKQEEKQRLEPKVLDLIDILNQMAQDINNNTGKNLLVMIDDLEKGNSDAEKQMHNRLFSDHYSVLTQPNFNIIYTLPVYFKALPSKRIEKEFIFSFSAVKIYDPENKQQDVPPLNKSSSGYQLISQFINTRIDDDVELFEADVLDELIRIGGGLFRDTDAAIADAADYAMDRGADKISLEDAKEVFTTLKKDYQPSIRSKELAILSKVAKSKKGWVDDVEPLLQSRAVVEYENGNVWLDVRYVLKAYLKSLLEDQQSSTPSIITD
jgi:hypothetical protein